MIANNTRDLVKYHEGCSLRPYRDTVGKLTIGWGRNLEDVGISQREADQMLDVDLIHAEGICVRIFGGWYALSAVRRAVLIDMAHNLGEGGLRSFRKMRAAIEAGEFALASLEMLDSKWASQVGARARRLANMMKDDQWPKI